MVLFTIPSFLILNFFKLELLANIFIYFGIILGSKDLFKEIAEGLLKKQFALDYIALMAIVTSIVTQEYLVAGIIALMLSSGRTLEEYGTSQAKKSLSLLVNRIPQNITLTHYGMPGQVVKISSVKSGQEILVRRGEVIPLDGILISDQGYADESSLTGEPYQIEKMKGDVIRSGTINIGQVMVIKVTRAEVDSTYKKIIDMVKAAQEEKSPFIRMADKYSTIFTIITFIIAGLAFLLSNDLKSILSVLVIATPCPLIIATPIALLGGVNRAARSRIIVKKLASLEALSRANVFVFDKTGTITIGKPSLTKIELLKDKFTEKEALAISLSLERNSLHPLAKTIIEHAKSKGITAPAAQSVIEKTGIGISGLVKGKIYTLTKIDDIGKDMVIQLKSENEPLALLRFQDVIKKDSKAIISKLKKLGLKLYIFTGDRQEVADHIAKEINESVEVRAGLKPEDKQKGIEQLKKQKFTIAMVGDGINDAPALAQADVGMVFSNQEQTAASEAADIVLLGSDFALTERSVEIARKTIYIAKQSIFWGIGLSITGMVFAAFGLIPPILGAGIQEAIDVAVIINALRARSA